MIKRGRTKWKGISKVSLKKDEDRAQQIKGKMHFCLLEIRASDIQHSVKFPHSPIPHYAFSSWIEKTMTKTIHCHWENRFVLLPNIHTKHPCVLTCSPKITKALNF